jgi:uncharacterized membrane protein HdeD (DUF308 family)
MSTAIRSEVDLFRRDMARNWWVMALRGAFGVAFGLLALLLPGVTMLGLVLFFAGWLFADGVFGLVAAFRAARRNASWGWLALSSLLSIGVAIVTVLWPAITVAAFVLLVAFWAIVTGVAMLAAVWKLDIEDGKWWLIVGGVLSILYGALLILAPMIGAIVLTWWLGAYALVFGIMLLAAAFRLRSQWGGGAATA